MKVISAAMPRTGTQSLKRALEILGYPTYGMGDCLQYYSHLRTFRDNASTPENIDYARLLSRYEGIVGMPAFAYYREMLKVFPNAKVIVSPRDAKSWYRSYSKLHTLVTGIRQRLWFLPRIRVFYATVNAVWFQGFFGGHSDSEHCIELYERYTAQVIADVPSEQLLVWTVDQGWEPLCEFLGEPVPDQPFPYMNKSESVVKRVVGLALLRDLIYLLLGLGLVALLVWAMSASAWRMGSSDSLWPTSTPSSTCNESSLARSLSASR